MKKVGIRERVRLANYVAGEGMRRLRRGIGAPVRLASVWRARAPERLVLAPQDLRTPDPIVARDIYGGYFAFAGRAVNTHGQSPFSVESPSDGWTRALMSFGWLRHLRAADTALARANARALVEDWIVTCGRPPATDPDGRKAHETGWDVVTVARRMQSWLSQSPIILEGADREFYRRFMKSLGRQAAWLSKVVASGLTGGGRLHAAVALAALGVCSEGLPGLRRRGTRLLAEQLERQILPDGGHISRNPRVIMELLLDLLPLRQAYAARGQQVPAQLLNAIDRIMPMLRAFRHGDGTLAHFNGMGVTPPEVLATLLAYDETPAAAVLNAPHSGYQRLSAGDALVIMDAGPPPPRLFSAAAHAGCLSFEFSCGADQIIVNCGAPDPNRPEARDASRQTAAHSTLVLDDTSSCRFATSPGLRAWLDAQIIAGPRQVESRRDADGRKIEATHDGYAQRLGLLHQRRILLDPSGIGGEDRLLPAAGAPPAGSRPAAVLRFHLHPSVKAVPLGMGRGIELTTSSAIRWLFEAEGVEPVLEESIFFAAPDGMRRTDQIVLAFAPGQDMLRWRLWRSG